MGALLTGKTGQSVQKFVPYVEGVQKLPGVVVFALLAAQEADSEMRAGSEGGNQCTQAAAGELGSFAVGLGSQ